MDDLLTDFGIAGINLVSDEELLGLDGKARDMVKRVKVLAAAHNAKADTGARAEFNARLHLLPKEIQEGLRRQRLQIVDYQFYSIKTLTSGNKSLKVFEGTDLKQPGIRNIQSAKLEKDVWFLLSAIQVRYDPTGGPNTYETNPARNFLDGEFVLSAGGKIVVPKNMSLSVFGQNNLTTQPHGFFKLRNPKLIEPQVDIVMDIDLAAAFGTDVDIRVDFIGAATVPY
jgi:hypothetical protein